MSIKNLLFSILLISQLVNANKLKFVQNLAQNGKRAFVGETVAFRGAKPKYFEGYIEQVKAKAKPNIPITNKGYYRAKDLNGNKAYLGNQGVYG